MTVIQKQPSTECTSFFFYQHCLIVNVKRLYRQLLTDIFNFYSSECYGARCHSAVAMPIGHTAQVQWSRYVKCSVRHGLRPSKQYWGMFCNWKRGWNHLIDIYASENVWVFSFINWLNFTKEVPLKDTVMRALIFSFFLCFACFRLTTWTLTLACNRGGLNTPTQVLLWFYVFFYASVFHLKAPSRVRSTSCSDYARLGQLRSDWKILSLFRISFHSKLIACIFTSFRRVSVKTFPISFVNWVLVSPHTMWRASQGIDNFLSIRKGFSLFQLSHYVKF